MKLAIVGAGKIVDFHLPALSAAGFELSAIAAKPGSENAKRVAQRFGVPDLYPSTEELIENLDAFDALLIACSSENLLEHLIAAKSHELPILVEKPVFVSNSDYDKLNHVDIDNPKIMVGYNRRFYPSVSQLSKKIDTLDYAVINVNVPELSGSSSFTFEDIEQCLRVNTVHIFDLINHLLPIDESQISIFVQKNSKIPYGYIVIFEHANFLLNLTITFGAPGNYKLECRTKDELITLEPLEKLNQFKGMQIIEPSTDYPIRIYTPKRIEPVSNQMDFLYKPGFLEQANHFYKLAMGESRSGHATLKDALKASRFASSLLGELWS